MFVQQMHELAQLQCALHTVQRVWRGAIALIFVIPDAAAGHVLSRAWFSCACVCAWRIAQSSLVPALHATHVVLTPPHCQDVNHGTVNKTADLISYLAQWRAAPAGFTPVPEEHSFQQLPSDRAYGKPRCIHHGCRCWKNAYVFFCAAAIQHQSPYQDFEAVREDDSKR